MKKTDKGKRSKTLSKVKPVKNISKNLQSFLEISLMQKKMSAKLNKIELSEEFMVMGKEEQPPEVFCKKGGLRNFAEFTGKHMCQSLFF